MNLDDLRSLFSRAGCTQLYAKPLAENDNSKNQIYFGPDFTALTLFPNRGVRADSSLKNLIYKAALNFGWLNNAGGISPAPGAQLILYPQYPEVRFSGFLKGSVGAPNELLNQRLAGRILFLGVTPDRQIVGYVAAGESELAHEFRASALIPSLGVFVELTLIPGSLTTDNRTLLLAELCRIHRIGWMDSKRLGGGGETLPCNAPNCGGYTLEAELGVRPNGKSEPDFLGYEVKQHSVPELARLDSGTITLMTPEPNGGVYAEESPAAFIRRYGYADKKGREDRLNFGGIFRAGERHAGTRLTLTLPGYAGGVITDENGCIALVDDAGTVAASWDFAGLMHHWTRKHAHAVYVPSENRTEPARQYRYGGRVRIAGQPDFLRLLAAFAAGTVYYDPGIKLEAASTAKPRLKRRSQFRIRSADLTAIYRQLEIVETCG